MLEVCEVGNSIGKEDYEAAIPDLRVGLINAQYDLRSADFPVIIWIAGDDRMAANELVNRLNEWMDSRFADTRVFADPTAEEHQRPQLWRLWRSLPPKGRAAFFVGGLMRAAIQRANGEIDEPDFSIWLRHIANMQNELVADGALILKFFLHTPAKQQKKSSRRPRRTRTPAGRSTSVTGPRWTLSGRCCPSPSGSCGRPVGRVPRGRSWSPPIRATATSPSPIPSWPRSTRD